MIDTKELRINNYVEIAESVVYMDVRLFHAVISGFPGYIAESISLTEDWLLKLGFDYHIEYGVKYYTDLECNLTICYKKIFLWQYNQGVQIKYVHQLQNLYFAITGKELKINSK